VQTFVGLQNKRDLHVVLGLGIALVKRLVNGIGFATSGLTAMSIQIHFEGAKF